jgi:uncharacterized phage protein (TIGR02218 family)
MKEHVAEWSRLLWCIRIELANGTTLRFSTYPYDIKMSGQTYKTYAGFTFSGIDFGTSFQSSAIDLKSFIGLDPAITIATIQSGIFDGAWAYLFLTDWANPVEDEEPLKKVLYGRTTINGKNYTIEAMGLIECYNVLSGLTHSTLCSSIFGGQGHGGCKVDLVPLRETGVVTLLATNYQFACDTLVGLIDSHSTGRVWFTSGANLGIPAQRISYFIQPGGIIVTTEPFPYAPALGDAITVEPGCRKRLEDCKRYNNVRRRRGFDWIPGQRFLRLVGGL